MSGAHNRLNVTPTVTTLAVIKSRLRRRARAQIVKEKADALTMRYRQILREIVEAKRALKDAMRDAHFAWTRAKYAGGDARRFPSWTGGTASVRSSRTRITWRG